MRKNIVTKRIFVNGNEFLFYINDEKKIVHGKTTIIARPYNCGDDIQVEATVRCSPDDHWDRVVGVYVCLGKLLTKINYSKRTWSQMKEYLNR